MQGGKRLVVFDVCNYILFAFLGLIMLYPFWHTLVGSLMSYEEYIRKAIVIYPERPTLLAYREIVRNGEIFTHAGVTLFITVVGTLSSLFVTSWVAYGLSKPFRGSTTILYFIVFTMFVNGGLIPTYIVYKSLGLIDRIAVYLLPSLINTFNLILMRTFYLAFSQELEDSAKIDGCNEFRTYFQIVLPLSKPILATIGLFAAVSFWNTFFPSLFFIRSVEKKTLQEYIYRIVSSMNQEQAVASDVVVPGETVRLANIILSALPIILVYPFLQKYFIKGIMIGAIKG